MHLRFYLDHEHFISSTIADASSVYKRARSPSKTAQKVERPVPRAFNEQ